MAQRRDTILPSSRMPPQSLHARHHTKGTVNGATAEHAQKPLPPFRQLRRPGPGGRVRVKWRPRSLVLAGSAPPPCSWGAAGQRSPAVSRYENWWERPAGRERVRRWATLQALCCWFPPSPLRALSCPRALVALLREIALVSAGVVRERLSPVAVPAVLPAPGGGSVCPSPGPASPRSALRRGGSAGGLPW